MTYTIIYTHRAVSEIREAMEWWRDHRSIADDSNRAVRMGGGFPC
ncbi:MAG TPA: hypothetical protein VNQ76_07565 [Planctomicrobium sp.]|nr:hypothetical protein [Planctomicrobium sp.]